MSMVAACCCAPEPGPCPSCSPPCPGIMCVEFSGIVIDHPSFPEGPCSVPATVDEVVRNHASHCSYVPDFSIQAIPGCLGAIFRGVTAGCAPSPGSPFGLTVPAEAIAGGIAWYLISINFAFSGTPLLITQSWYRLPVLTECLPTGIPYVHIFDEITPGGFVTTSPGTVIIS